MGFTTNTFNTTLDQARWVGQRSNSFVFRVVNSDGFNRGTITPLRNGGGDLSHDTSRTIKRHINLTLGVTDSAFINPVSDRLLISYVVPGVGEYPLGRYIFTDETAATYSDGRKLLSVTLDDEMFLVDQPILQGISGDGTNTVSLVIPQVLTGLPITFQAGYTQFGSKQSFSIGTSRGQVLSQLALAGAYWSPWFDNDGVLQFLPSFDPAKQIPDFDFDAGTSVMGQVVATSTNLLTAPNRYIVISNNAESNSSAAGFADVPDSAPNSLVNRGFVIAKVSQLQAADQSQARGMAFTLANQNTIIETVELTTAVDPRHDSYNVIRWQGDLWLELAWTINFDGTMTHTLRKAYT
jgi:hypothetical protein